MRAQQKRRRILLSLTILAWMVWPLVSIDSQSHAGVSRTPSGWTTHSDPAGFSVRLPAGWTARGEQASGRVAISGTNGEQLIVWPVFTQHALQVSEASRVLQQLAPKLWPTAQWQTPQAIGTSSVRQQGRADERIGVSALVWVSSPKGSAGYVYLLSAPEARFRQTEEAFAEVLRSFRVSGAPSSQAGSSLTYIKWQDPRENAFTIEVPQQWRVSGGLFRFASVDVRPAVEVISPDGKIRLTAGDAEIPPFVVPDQMLQSLGFREGTSYSPGYGVTMTVRRYLPGVEFAKQYISTKMTGRCQNLSITQARDLPEAARTINAIYGQFGGSGMSMQVSTGETAFTCQANQSPRRGYYFAGTMLTSAYGSGLWTVPYLHGYLATADQAEVAQAVLSRMVQSVQLNPQWLAMQQHLTGQTSQIVSRTGAEISRIISQSYWSQQRSLDELSRRRSNATLGVEDVVDPLTGREIKVESGANYYWIDQRGNIVGTTTDTTPAIDFRQLVRLP
jgi:hypothetical protein